MARLIETQQSGRSSITVDLVHSLLIDEHDCRSNISNVLIRASHPRYALFLTQRLGGAIDSLYIMPVANSVRSHRESIAREMRLFHRKTGPRSAHAGGTASFRFASFRSTPLRFAPRNTMTPARRATTRMYAMRLR